MYCTKKVYRSFCAVLLTISLCSVSSFAAPTINPVVSYTDAGLPGYVINDFYISYTVSPTSVEMLSNLTAGSVWQAPATIPNPNPPFGTLPYGADTPPEDAWASYYTDLKYDTFVTFGSWTNDTADPGPYSYTAPDLFFSSSSFAGSDGSMNFGNDTTGVDITWTKTAPLVSPPLTSYPVARITLSSDAQGTFEVMAWNANGPADTSYMSYNIVNGAIVVPEPATMGLLALGGIGLVLRRRRK